MTFRIIVRGSPRPVRHDFLCPVHGHFTALVDSGTDEKLCPARGNDGNWCGVVSPWSPRSSPAMRVRRVEATRGNHEKAEHKGWLDTTNLEEGQPWEEFEAERDAVAEELRKEQVMEAIRSDR